MRLEVLVIIIEDEEYYRYDEYDPPDDPRIVYLPYPDAVPDWEAPVRGQPDIWSRAEEMVLIQRMRQSQANELPVGSLVV